MTQVAPPRRSLRAIAPRQLPQIPLSEKSVILTVFGLGVVILALVTALGLADVHDPRRAFRLIGEVGAACIGMTFTWVLAARTGGPKKLVTGLAGVLVAATLLTEIPSGLALTHWSVPELRTSSSIATATVAAILGIVLTRPATSVLTALKETTTALGVAAIGSFAAVGWAPAVESFAWFKWSVGGIAAIGLFWLVFRLGAGLHGLGRRGVVIVIGGAFAFALVLAYAEFLRSYGSHQIVAWMTARARWSQTNLGAYPRPMMALIGIPALMFGVHMRSRRGQGWWLCAYAVAATAPIATTLVNSDIGLREAALSLVYSAVIGFVVGAVLIRLDLAFSSVGGTRSAGRRVADVAPETPGVRSEPARHKPLL